MATYLFIRRHVIVASLMLIFGLPGVAAQAADQPSAGATPSISTAGPIAPAAGAVEDTLKACLARIPKDASAGQSILAERGCQRDQLERTSLQTAPRF
jgi:hypothetical protein